MDILKIVILPCLYSFIASVAFGTQFNIRPSKIFTAAAGGALSQLIFSLMTSAGQSEMLCYFIAACAVSAYSEILARALHVPANMYLVVSIIPLVPGGYIYNTMITLVNGDINSFAEQCAAAFGMAGSIAMGVFAVSSAARILKK